MSTESTLGILPEGWDTRTLKLCLEKLKSGKYVERGWSPQCLSRPAQNAWGVLKTTSVQMGEFLPEYNKELPKSLEPKTGLEVNDGDFLVTTTGPRNRCGVICRVRTTPRNLIFSGKILRFRADESQVLGSYLMYLLMSPGYQKELDGLKVGTSDSSVSIGNQQILDLEIPLASIEEQAKIVEILEEQLPRLDAALASVRGVREKAARFRRSLLHVAFTGALTGHDTSTGKLPDGWILKELGRVANVNWGDLQVTKSSYVPDGHIAYSATGPDGFLDYFDFDQDGIVLSAIGAGCGKTWFAKGKWSAIKNTMTIVQASEAVELRFLFQQLSDPEIWPKRGSGQPFISQKDARELVIKVPPLTEQVKIVGILEEQLSRLDAALAVGVEIEQKVSALRRSLLHAAFTGELTREWREGAHV